MTGRRRSWQVLTPDPVDVAVAATALSFALSTAAFVAADRTEPRLTAAAIGVQAASALALLWRRRAPVAVWLAVGVLAVLYGLAEWPDPLVPFVPMVALVAVFEWTSATARAAVFAATVAITVVGTAVAGDSSGLDWWTAAFVVISCPLAGAYLRTRRG